LLQLKALLISARDGKGLSASRLGCFAQRETAPLPTHVIGAWEASVPG